MLQSFSMQYPDGSQTLKEATDHPSLKLQSGWDLLLYLAGGFGVYTLASLLLSLTLREITIGLTFTLYALNGLCIGGSVYFWGVRRRKTSWQEIGVWPVHWDWHWLVMAIAVVAVTLPLRGLLALAVTSLLNGGLQSLQLRAQLISANAQFSLLNFFLTWFGVGVIAPISEELYFRGLLHRWFIGRTPKVVRIGISSLLFGFAHFDSLPVAVSAFVMGAANAWVYERTHTLWVPILVHMLTNTLGVVMLYLVLAVQSMLKISVF